jgi:uncharacterized protein (DUF2384 family)
MSGPDPVHPPAANPRRPRSMEFRKRRSPPMPAEQSRRQSQLMQSAWRHFGDAAPVIAFLNTRHDALDALPLHLAIESDEGLERVEKLLKELTRQA